MAAVQLPEHLEPEQLAGFVLGLRLGGYGFVVSAEAPPQRTREVRLVHPAPTDELRDVLTKAATLAAATALARDLANSPSNVKSPDWLANTAAGLAGGVPGLHAEVRDEQWLAEHG